MTGRQLLALLVPVLGLALAWVMDRLAAVRREGGERGDYWSRAVLWLCLGPALLCLLSGWLPTIYEPLWLRGLHLQLDRVPGSGLAAPYAYLAALAIPFACWSLFLLVGLALRPGAREAGRWLAGRAGELPRGWVLLCGLPLAVSLWFGFSRLGTGAEAYPAATWSTQALLLVSLLFVAGSAGKAPAQAMPGEAAAPAPARELRPWPEALAARGIVLCSLFSWPAGAPARAVQGAAAAELADRLVALGAHGVAPEMVEVAARLLDPARRGDPACLVFAPDGCGQVEVLGLAAGDVAQRFNEVTLVVVPARPEALLRQLAPWLPAECRAAAVGPDGKPPEGAAVWVVDAETLSERFLRRVANDRLATRIGLVVWWDVHFYTGVLAANVWAVSRRLDRLMRAQERSDVRVLVLVRAAEHGEAQMARFIRDLLPYSPPGESEVHVERRAPRAVDVHVLEGHRDFFQNAAGQQRIPAASRHPLLVAALASVEEGWPTRLEAPRDVTVSEINPVGQLAVGDRLLKDLLLADGAASGALLSALESGDVLSLAAMASQGGRAAPAELPHHWGLLLPPNPYAAHVLARWAAAHPDGREAPASRLLVGARGNPRILRRHLLLALSEQKDTLTGLRQTFHDEALIGETLEKIDAENGLDRSREVRFLDAEGRVRPDHLYESRLAADAGLGPLDTVGTRLIAVLDKAGGADGGVRLRVDPERLTIQAYPGRVFLHAGRRYEVSSWDSSAEVETRGWLECEAQGTFAHTWRIRRARVHRLQKPDQEVAVDPEGRLVKRFAADLTYEEEVEGHLRLERDLTTGAEREQTPELRLPIPCRFVTRGLVLRLAFTPPREGLEALCLALRHVLPVHLGVEDDALEVVALLGEPLWGLAIVDLYPGGFGLADAIAEDNALPLRLLQWTRDWLREPDAGAALLASPLARATLGRERPDPAAAVALLERLT
ncbi:MAG TPA: hypothetical protein VGS07_18750 [Thermoanaerobaculia bacterium]|jgi:hypothetical protein|nr:hypothetical protein [Thermoanaerobaculia bacterium]